MVGYRFGHVRVAKPRDVVYAGGSYGQGVGCDLRPLGIDGYDDFVPQAVQYGIKGGKKPPPLLLLGDRGRSRRRGDGSQVQDLSPLLREGEGPLEDGLLPGV